MSLLLARIERYRFIVLFNFHLQPTGVKSEVLGWDQRFAEARFDAGPNLGPWPLRLVTCNLLPMCFRRGAVAFAVGRKAERSVGADLRPKGPFSGWNNTPPNSSGLPW